jgi:hypothetical protein
LSYSVRGPDDEEAERADDDDDEGEVEEVARDRRAEEDDGENAQAVIPPEAGMASRAATLNLIMDPMDYLFGYISVSLFGCFNACCFFCVCDMIPCRSYYRMDRSVNDVPSLFGFHSPLYLLLHSGWPTKTRGGWKVDVWRMTDGPPECLSKIPIHINTPGRVLIVIKGRWRYPLER